jgi:hypothetical protein
MEIEKYGFGVFVINDFISREECIEHMSVADKIGYEKAMIQTIEGPKFIEDIRNNDRVIHDNKEIADKLYTRAKALLTQVFDAWTLTGLNERLRFYRYEGSQIFKWHKDGTYA